MKKIRLTQGARVVGGMISGGFMGASITGFALYELVKQSPDLMPDLAIQIGIATWAVLFVIAGVLHFCVEESHKKDLLTADDLKGNGKERVGKGW